MKNTEAGELGTYMGVLKQDSYFIDAKIWSILNQTIVLYTKRKQMLIESLQ